MLLWNCIRCGRLCCIIILFCFEYALGYDEWNGKWCPKVQTRMVTCRQPRWDWHQDRSASQGHIRKYYTVVYRQKKEVRWRCCPGFQGENCDKECFNCTTIDEIKSRLANTESIVRTLTYTRSSTQDTPEPVNSEACDCKRGEKGDRGSPGLPGQPGSTGPHGPIGPRGESASDMGPQAIMAGKTGRPGIPGQRGDMGIPGSKGDRGLPGMKGQSGESPIFDYEKYENRYNTIIKLEKRLQALESQIYKLEHKLNKTQERKEEYEVLEARVVLLEEIFPKLSDEHSNADLNYEEGETTADSTQIKQEEIDCECSKPPQLPTFPREIAKYLINKNRTETLATCKSLGLLLSHYLDDSSIPNGDYSSSITRDKSTGFGDIRRIQQSESRRQISSSNTRSSSKVSSFIVLIFSSLCSSYIIYK